MGLKPNDNELVDVEIAGTGYQVVCLDSGCEGFFKFNGKIYNDVFLTVISAIRFIKEEIVPKKIALSPSEFEKIEYKNWSRAIDTMLHDYNDNAKHCVDTNYNGIKIIPVTIKL